MPLKLMRNDITKMQLKNQYFKMVEFDHFSIQWRREIKRA